MTSFYKNNFVQIIKNLHAVDDFFLTGLEKLILKVKKKKKKIIICGNGGSAATASHVSVDLTKNAGVKTMNFNEYDLITCFANDFGYENWVSKSLEYYAEKEDLLIMMSCSGNSMNLVNAAKYAIKNEIKLVTLTGCNKNNKLNSFKSNLKYWVNSNNYNNIEVLHHVILLSITDKIILSNNA